MPNEENLSTAEASSAISDRTLISRSALVVTTEVDGEILMMTITDGRCFGLNDIGSDIWQRIQSPCTFAELLERLAADYDAGYTTIRTDVRALLAHMVAQNLIRLD